MSQNFTPDDLPPWLRGDDSPQDDPPPAPPPEDEETDLPPWLRAVDQQAAPAPSAPAANLFGVSEDYLSLGDTLREQNTGEQTYDQWSSQLSESRRVKDIEEEVPDLLGDTPPTPPANNAPGSKNTGMLPDWFLGLEALDTSDAPDWFTNQPPAASPPSRSGAPPTGGIGSEPPPWLAGMVEEPAPPAPKPRPSTSALPELEDLPDDDMLSAFDTPPRAQTFQTDHLRDLGLIDEADEAPDFNAFAVDPALPAPAARRFDALDLVMGDPTPPAADAPRFDDWDAIPSFAGAPAQDAPADLHDSWDAPAAPPDNESFEDPYAIFGGNDDPFANRSAGSQADAMDDALSFGFPSAAPPDAVGGATTILSDDDDFDPAAFAAAVLQTGEFTRASVPVEEDAPTADWNATGGDADAVEDTTAVDTGTEDWLSQLGGIIGFATREEEPEPDAAVFDIQPAGAADDDWGFGVSDPTPDSSAASVEEAPAAGRANDRSFDWDTVEAVPDVEPETRDDDWLSGFTPADAPPPQAPRRILTGMLNYGRTPEPEPEPADDPLAFILNEPPARRTDPTIDGEISDDFEAPQMPNIFGLPADDTPADDDQLPDLDIFGAAEHDERYDQRAPAEPMDWESVVRARVVEVEEEAVEEEPVKPVTSQFVIDDSALDSMRFTEDLISEAPAATGSLTPAEDLGWLRDETLFPEMFNAPSPTPDDQPSLDDLFGQPDDPFAALTPSRAAPAPSASIADDEPPLDDLYGVIDDDPFQRLAASDRSYDLNAPVEREPSFEDYGVEDDDPFARLAASDRSYDLNAPVEREPSFEDYGVEDDDPFARLAAFDRAFDLNAATTPPPAANDQDDPFAALTAPTFDQPSFTEDAAPSFDPYATNDDDPFAALTAPTFDEPSFAEDAAPSFDPYATNDDDPFASLTAPTFDQPSFTEDAAPSFNPYATNDDDPFSALTAPTFESSFAAPKDDTLAFPPFGEDDPFAALRPSEASQFSSEQEDDAPSFADFGTPDDDPFATTITDAAPADEPDDLSAIHALFGGDAEEADEEPTFDFSRFADGEAAAAPEAAYDPFGAAQPMSDAELLASLGIAGFGDDDEDEPQPDFFPASEPPKRVTSETAAPDWLNSLEGVDLAEEVEPEPTFELDDAPLFDSFDDLGMEAPPAIAGEEPSEIGDIEGYLASLSSSAPAVRPATGDLLARTDFDVDSIFDDDLPPEPSAPAFAPETFGGEAAVQPMAIDWLQSLQPNVGEVSATASVRQRKDRPVEELSDRLQALRASAEDLPDAEAASAPDSLSAILPGIADELPAAAIAIPAPTILGAAITPDQQKRADLLRSLVGVTAPAHVVSAIEATYNTPYLPGLDENETVLHDELTAEEAAAPRVQPVRSRRKARRARRVIVDRLLVTAILIAAVLAPFYIAELRIGALPPAVFAAGTPADAAFDHIDALPAGAVVLVGVEYGSAAAAELDGFTDAILRHLLLRGAYPVVIGGNPIGLLRAEGQLETISTDAAFTRRIGASGGLRAGEDYYLVRYLPGGAIGLRAFSQDSARALLTDISGQAGDLGIASLQDFSLIVFITDSADDARAYAEQVAPLANAPLVAAVSYAAAPLVEPYTTASFAGAPPSLAGLLVGYEDAYTYASAVSDPDAIEAARRAGGRPDPLLIGPTATPTLASSPLSPGEGAEATRTPRPTRTPSGSTPGVGETAPPVTGSTAGAAQPGETTAVVDATQAINLRAGPGTAQGVLRGLQPGTRVTVIGTNAAGDWTNVRTDDGTEGWVSSALIDIIEGGANAGGVRLAKRIAPSLLPLRGWGWGFGGRDPFAGIAVGRHPVGQDDPPPTAIRRTPIRATATAAPSETPEATNTARPTRTPPPTTVEPTTTARPTRTIAPTETPLDPTSTARPTRTIAEPTDTARATRTTAPTDAPAEPTNTLRATRTLAATNAPLEATNTARPTRTLAPTDGAAALTDDETPASPPPDGEEAGGEGEPTAEAEGVGVDPTASLPPSATPTDSPPTGTPAPTATPFTLTISAPTSPGFRDERWYAMTMGILVSAGVITTGAVLNIARTLLRRGKR